MKELIPQEVIQQRIFLIRGRKVMIDRDLAELYGVETKYLNRQVKRNIKRFPEEFVFQLKEKEKSELGELEKRIEGHDVKIQTIFKAIRQLMEPPPEPPKRRIGFHP